MTITTLPPNGALCRALSNTNLRVIEGDTITVSVTVEDIAEGDRFTFVVAPFDEDGLPEDEATLTVSGQVISETQIDFVLTNTQTADPGDLAYEIKRDSQTFGVLTIQRGILSIEHGIEIPRDTFNVINNPDTNVVIGGLNVIHTE